MKKKIKKIKMFAILQKIVNKERDMKWILFPEATPWIFISEYQAIRKVRDYVPISGRGARSMKVAPVKIIINPNE